MEEKERINLKKRLQKNLFKIKKSYSEKKERDKLFAHIRINSLDVLRGWFTIVLIFLICQGLPESISPCFKISEGAGINLADITLPMFIMIMGASIPFFVKKNYTESQSVFEVIKMSFKRGLALFLIGVAYSFVFLEGELMVRILGPYQMIAIVYLVCILIYLGFLKLKIKNNALTYVFLIFGTIISLILLAIGKERIALEILACIGALPLGMYGLSLGLILNKKPIKKKYRRYLRPHKVKNNGWSKENFLVDLKSYFNIKSIRSILSNYYRFNKDAKKIINMFLVGMLLYLSSKALGVSLPLNRSILNLSFNLRVASYLFLVETLLFIFCDILKVRYFFNMLKKMGENSIFIIILISIIHRLFSLIKLKSLYTATAMGLNSWFTTDFILPVTGIDYASTTYALVVTIIWCLIFNLLDKYDLKINL